MAYRYYSKESILTYTQERKTKKNLNVIGSTRVSNKKDEEEVNKRRDMTKKLFLIY